MKECTKGSLYAALVILLCIAVAILLFGCTKPELITERVIDTVYVYVNNDTTIIDTVFIYVNDDVVVDGAGNIYNTIAIGDQVWLDKNLVTSKYNDGTDILYPGSDKQLWISSNKGSYAWFKDDSLNYGVFGALYNFEAVRSNKLCPHGFHVPTDNDWMILEMYLGLSEYDALRYGIRGSNVEGGMLKGLSYWSSPNVNATNEYGFNAIPANIRYYNGEYCDWQYSGIESVTYWSSTIDSDNGLGINRSLETNHGSIRKWRHSLLMGYSVRCVKN